MNRNKIAGMIVAFAAAVVTLSGCAAALGDKPDSSELAASRIPTDSSVEYVSGEYSESYREFFGLNLRCKDRTEVTLKVGQTMKVGEATYEIKETRKDAPTETHGYAGDWQESISVTITTGQKWPAITAMIFSSPGFLRSPDLYNQAYKEVYVGGGSSDTFKIDSSSAFDKNGNDEIAEVTFCSK